MANIAFYGSHNTAIAVEQDGQIICVLELERFIGYKNSAIAQYKVARHKNIYGLRKIVDDMLLYIEKQFGIKEYDKCFWMNSEVVIDQIFHQTHKFVKANEYIVCDHHFSHAGNVFYQSPFENALTISFDGGGNDGKFNIYFCNRGSGPMLLDRIYCPSDTRFFFDLGFPYMSFGAFLKDIKYEPLSDGNLVYPGKLMGLASYGVVRPEWLNAMTTYYKSDPQGPNYEEKMNVLGEAIGVKFNVNERLDGQLAYDIAATSQRVFEDCFLEYATPYIDKFKHLPICLAGGCALNIILNTRIAKHFGRKVFVGPTPNDCGLAVGMLLNHIKPKTPIDITYAGPYLLDKDMLCYYMQNNSFWLDKLDMDVLVNDLANNKIVGVARGRSEHGARALGNRSIICSPFGKEMKDTLNEKVKHREWYRPFAPVVRLEDVKTYFEWETSSRWMSFCPTVREEYREKLGAITHVDNTARVQTVTRAENPWLYDLLTKFYAKTGVGVLLNTSFNVAGMPILTTCKEALQVLETTQMDGLIIENEYIKKVPYD